MKKVLAALATWSSDQKRETATHCQYNVLKGERGAGAVSEAE
jgi:hypothetical protein